MTYVSTCAKCLIALCHILNLSFFYRVHVFFYNLLSQVPLQVSMVKNGESMTPATATALDLAVVKPAIEADVKLNGKTII